MTTSEPQLNDDFRDMFACLLEAEVEFIVVGAHALAVHGYPRSTGDLDILVRPSADNSLRVMDALEAFGAPTAAHGVSSRDFAARGAVYQIGLPPRRIDLLTEISGVEFDEARGSQVVVRVGDFELPFLGRESLISNKRAAGRPKDLADAEELERLGR